MVWSLRINFHKIKLIGINLNEEFEMGDILFWHHQWFGNEPLKQMFLDLFVVGVIS